MKIQSKYKAAIYIRVSTEEQAVEGQSASAQEETLRQYCSTYNIEIFDVYLDLGISGKSLKDRRELMRLLEDCRNEKFNLVLVWKISRLSRNLKDLLYLIDIFENSNVHFASCSEKFDTSTPLGRMTLQLLGSISEFERNTIVENVRLGLAEFARKGGKASSVLGYDNVDKKLIINENEANIVKLIFTLRARKGLSFSAIARHLNGLGYRTKRGSRFRSSSISYIIKNPVYIGINRHNIKTENEYYIESLHPAIISSELWSAVQSTCNKPLKRTATVNSYSAPYKVNCMKCNSFMKIFYSFSKGKKYKYFRCCRCSNYVNAEKLEKTAAQEILLLLDDKTVYESVYGLMNHNTSTSEKDDMALIFIESEICRLEKIKAQYFSLFESCKINDIKSFADRMEEIELKLKALEKRKLVKSNPILTSDKEVNYEEYFDGIKAGISALEPAVTKQIFSCLIKCIKAYKDEVNIVLYL